MPFRSRMGRLRDLDRDLIRAIARVCFTDLVGECSRSGSDVVSELSVVGCRRDDNIISQYVHGAAISRPPSQFHPMVGSLGLHTRLELDRCRSCRRCRRGRCTWASGRRWSWCCTARGGLLVEEGILLGLAVDWHPSVRPRREVVGGQCRTVVVVARIAVYDAGVGLAGQRGDYVAERHVGEPSCAVVGGLAPPHLVARNARVALLAVGTSACVIPHREESTTRADRDVRL